MAIKLMSKRAIWVEILRSNIGFRRVGMRTFLSEAYPCEDAWQKRLDSPLLKNLKMSLYFIEIDKKFQTKRLASGVDIDMFANNVTEPSQLDELEHLLYRFRGTKRCAEVMDSTHYATVRAFLKFKEFDALFRILRDRVDYGIFPDAFTYNLMMDNFIKLRRYRDAAEIAVLMMLQEDLSNHLNRILGLYSCHMFLSEGSLDSWHLEINKGGEEIESEVKQTEKVEGDDDDDDEVYVRVPYLRNPWFDGHFDVTEPKTLIGKTMYLMGREEKNPLGWSCQLIGLGMQNKWAKAAAHLDHLSQIPSAVLFEDEVSKFKVMLHEISDAEAKAKWAEQFDHKIQILRDEGKVSVGSFAEALRGATKLIPELEKYDIERQKQLFTQWERERITALEAQEKDITKEKKLQEIIKKKTELYWKEKLLFFFENEDDIKLELEKVESIVETLKKDTVDKDEYEPPNIIKKKPSKLSKLRKLAAIKTL